MRSSNGLVAFTLAALVTVVGISAQPAPVAAADPSPAPTTSPDPTPDPSASAEPTPTPAPETPAPTPTPAPDVSPDPAPAATAATVVSRPNHRATVRRIALRQRHKRYRRGAVGPRAFDCSGLVRFAYRHAHVGKRLGGGHSARAMLAWGRRHHRTGRHHPRVGDVVIYGGGSHAAIYIGNGRVVSALNPRQGIRVTRLHALRQRFTTFIHTRI